MNDVIIGKGNFRGKGVYANRDFKKDEIVIQYDLKELSNEDFRTLPKDEHAFVHSFWGEIYLFRGPSRFVNHSARPSTYQDLHRKADIAIRDIKKGEEITTSATRELENEILSLIETIDGTPPTDITWLKKGYRNAIVTCTKNGKRTKLKLKRIEGRWFSEREHV